MRPQPHPADAIGAVFAHEAVWVHAVGPVLPHQACSHLHLSQPDTVPELQENTCALGGSPWIPDPFKLPGAPL
jgi:hypothetical protein